MIPVRHVIFTFPPAADPTVRQFRNQKKLLRSVARALTKLHATGYPCSVVVHDKDGPPHLHLLLRIP